MSGELFPEILTKKDIGDWIWPSSNYYGIPDLLSSLQPRGLELPVNRIGAKARKCRVEGQTLRGYTDDYRINGLFKDPSWLVNSGCRALVEPNFSTNGEMPKAVALSYVYAKRWIARWAQSYGIEIWVDLAMNERHSDIALLGVPKDWKAYATYTYITGYDDEWLFRQHDQACKHSSMDEKDGLMFWVYGGEDHIQELCQERGWLWTPAHQQAYLRNVGGTNVREDKPKMPRQRGNRKLEKGIVIEDMRKTVTLMDWC
ncbi:DUF4417 domain-containing protein [Candidatus Pacearchaeota archaeon]|jgi:hypothetical protein|nr:DUF4417 domain-containing protein [Candidatus Pacearchaeota archaeon]